MRKKGLFIILAVLLVVAGCGKSDKERDVSGSTPKEVQEEDNPGGMSDDKEKEENDSTEDNSEEEASDGLSSSGSILDRAKQARDEATAQALRTWILVAIAEAQVQKWQRPDGTIQFRWPETLEGLKDIKELDGEYALLRDCLMDLLLEDAPEMSVKGNYLVVEISSSNVKVEVLNE